MPIIRDRDSQLYAFSAGDLEPNELRVLRFSGTEGISELFRFDLELVSRTSDIDFATVVGKPAAFAMTLGNEPRYVNGMLSRFEQGAVAKGFTHYFAELVPRVWTLLHRVDTRIFQKKNIQAILESVLKDAGVPSTAYRISLQGSYKEREYCVQYQESDWAFLSRLMEEEGIFYFFEHKPDDHVLVIADNSSVHVPITGDTEIPFRATANLDADGREYAASFRWSESVRIGAVAMRNYAFKTPKANLDAKNKASEGTELELYEYKHGSYATADVGKQRSKARLEEQQALRRVGTGHGVVSRFTPGFKFTLEGHARSELNREYLLTDVRHQGYSPQALEEQLVEAAEETEYTNEFRCIPSDVTYRPLRVTPSPFIRGTQTATVVGPAGEEIYCDEYGRVKLHFPWDRRPTADENSSCWIRVVQTFVGSIWIPRIGQEVVVGFHEGDPDQPFVFGRVPNADLMPPYSLPDEKTKTSLKSASTSGAHGFNEIRFEDKQGQEQLFIHGEKNLDLRVKNSRYESIGYDTHQIVDNDQIEHIKNERHTTVDADDITAIAGDRHLKVGGKQAVETGASYSLTVGTDMVEVVQANHSEETAGNFYLKAMGIVIESLTGITIKCGANSVVVDPVGVTLKGTMVTLDGPMVMIASGPGSPAMSGSASSAVSPLEPKKAQPADDADPGKVAEAKAYEMQTGQGKYGAAQIKPYRHKDKDPEKKSWIEFVLQDEHGKPVPGERYEVKLPDGKTARGSLDQKGFARIEGIDPGSCEICFPDLDKDAWKPG